MKRSGILQRKLLFWVVLCCLAVFGFIGEIGNAQTKTAKKSAASDKSLVKKESVPKKETTAKTAKIDSKSKADPKSKPKDKSKTSEKADSAKKKETTAAAKNALREKSAKDKSPVKKPSEVKSKNTAAAKNPKPAETTSKAKNTKDSKEKNSKEKIADNKKSPEKAKNPEKKAAAAVKKASIRTENLRDEKREPVRRNPIEKRLPEAVDRNFDSSVKTFEFLTRARNEAKDYEMIADYSFKRFLALGDALKNIPFGKSEEKNYKEFLKKHDSEIIYSEPSGKWLVRANLFWELYNTYAKSSIAEEIAWQAARNPIPGECEGYTNCYIYLVRVTDGEYLNHYPGGKYSAQALKNITELFAPIAADVKENKVYTAPTDAAERTAFNQLLDELRTIISRLSVNEKSQAIEHLNKIAAQYK